MSSKLSIRAHSLVLTYARPDIPWRDLDPEVLFTMALDDLAAVGECMTSGATPEEVISEIGATMGSLAMLADTISENGTASSRVMLDVKELGEYLVTMAPEEIGAEDDANIVQTALRLLKRQLEGTRH